MPLAVLGKVTLSLFFFFFFFWLKPTNRPKMMRMLGLNEEELISIKNVTLPLGRFVKVQPQSLEFLDVSNPRAVYVPVFLVWSVLGDLTSRVIYRSLEHELAKFSCLSANDIISIKFNNKKFELKIVETLPANAICIVETDVEVDFAPPPGYVEPQRPPSASGVPLGTSPNQQVKKNLSESTVLYNFFFRLFGFAP